MKNLINIDATSQIPVYKQIIMQVEEGVNSGKFATGAMIPSMNELALEHGISRETAKKAYNILRDKGIITARQGKGFFISAPENVPRKMRILLILDKLSNIKQVTCSAFVKTIGDTAEVNILLHSQQVEILEYYINESLDEYDYFVITPHFPLDAETQKRALKCIQRIPNRKLILLDHHPDGIRGNVGSIYQDFENDAYDALSQAKDELVNSRKLNLIIEPTSLYHPFIESSIVRFCIDNNINFETFKEVSPEIVHKGETYIILTGQLGSSLTSLARAARANSLEPGVDFGIISYNESPLDEIILGGLTTISADFEQMGVLAARMILDEQMQKIHCNFKMNRRSTF